MLILVVVQTISVYHWIQYLTNIHGTEYEIGSHSNIFPKNIGNHDAPCAVW